MKSTFLMDLLQSVHKSEYAGSQLYVQYNFFLRLLKKEFSAYSNLLNTEKKKLVSTFKLNRFDEVTPKNLQQFFESHLTLKS